MDINFVSSFWWNNCCYKKMTKKKINYFITALIISFIFLTLYFGLNKKNIYTTDNVKIKNIENFKTKELFSGKSTDFLSLIDEKKKFTILNIWASWCLPCRNEHEFLVELSKNPDITIIGLNYKDKEDNAKSFIKEFGNPFNKILIDDLGLISIELGAYGVPETYLINNLDKKIITKYIGPINNVKMKKILSLMEL